MVREVLVCELEDVPSDKALKVDVNGKQIMLRKLANRILATSATCTYRNVDLTERGVFDEEYVTCSNHLTTFDMITGEVIQPPATVPLEVYSVAIKENKVYLTLNKNEQDD